MHQKWLSSRVWLTGLSGLIALMVLSTSGVEAREVLRSGTFKGAGGHRSSGGVEIVMDGQVKKVVFKGNFRLNGAPDPKIAFGNGKYVRGTIFAKLKKLRGAQEYALPLVMDISKYSQVWLWCEKFNVPLAVANLN